MTHHNFIRTERQSGIALLMTMMVLSVVLAVTLAIVELSLKQLALSVDSRDSEIAFHAANAGLECARYTRRNASSSFENGANSATLKCFGVSTTIVKVATTSIAVATTSNGAIGKIFRYQKSVSWGGNRCSEIDVITMVVSTSSPASLIMAPLSGKSLFPGYPTATKSCAAGGTCTIASVAGYNSLCSATSTDGVLKRQVLLEF
jgi:Tfp pilus assembly protein PilX